MYVRPTLDHGLFMESEPLHDFNIFAYFTYRAKQRAAVALIASDVYDVWTRAKDVVRASREDDRSHLRILLSLERVLEHSSHVSMCMADAQGVKVGQVGQTLCERGQNGVCRVPREADSNYSVPHGQGTR